MFELLEKNDIYLIPKNKKFKKRKFKLTIKKWKCNIGISYSISLNRIKLLNTPKYNELKIIKKEFYDNLNNEEIFKFIDNKKRKLYFENFKLIKIKSNNNDRKNKNNRYQTSYIQSKIY